MNIAIIYYMDKSNYHKLQKELLTDEIKSVKSQIELLQNKLHRLQEQHAWIVLVEAGRISSKSGLEEIETIKREERLKRESMEDWSKGVKGVPRRFRESKTDNKKSGPTIKRGNLEKWLEKRGEIK